MGLSDAWSADCTLRGKNMLPNRGSGPVPTLDPSAHFPPSSPWLAVSDPSDTPPPALGGFALDVGDDLLAAAVAAVEARTRKTPPNPDEMSAFEDDLEVGEDEALLDNPPVLADDGSEVGVVFDDGGESPSATGSGASGTLAPDALEQVEALTEALAGQEQAAAALTDERNDLKGQVATLTAALEQERADKRKAVGLARRWKERAERAEQRLAVSRDAGAEAEERALRAEAAIADVEERARDELRRASARRLKDVDEVRHAAPGKVLKQLLPAIDNLELALRHADQDPSRVIEGLEMIRGQFASSLTRLGVERVEAAPGTPFSPERHEAFSQEETDAVPAGTVLTEVAAGYRIGDRLLRAARVVVALAPAGSAAEQTSIGDSGAPAEPADPPDAPHETAAAQPRSEGLHPTSGCDSESESADAAPLSGGTATSSASPDEE